MAETAVVPAEWFAIFQHDNLPGHEANVHIKHPDEEVDWPVIGGVRAMPMSGKFLVRDGAGRLTAHEDGFLVVGAAGHPFWVSGIPGA